MCSKSGNYEDRPIEQMSQRGYLNKAAERFMDVLTSFSGWGTNDIHPKVLSLTDEDLPEYRNVSITKKANPENH